jgi:hypothetical protein
MEAVKQFFIYALSKKRIEYRLPVKRDPGGKRIGILQVAALAVIRDALFSHPMVALGAFAFLIVTVLLCHRAHCDQWRYKSYRGMSLARQGP